MTKTLIADFPAYAIYKMPEFRQAKMIDGMEFAMPFESARYGTLYHFFQIGSVIGYAVKNGDDPIAAFEQAKERGHDLHYVFGLGVSITNQRREKGEKFALNWGDIIGFYGKRFRLDKAPNNNVALIEVETE
jgi:hypothetical protein